MELFFVAGNADHAPACWIVRASTHAEAKRLIKESLGTSYLTGEKKLSAKVLQRSGNPEVLEAWIQ